MKAVSFVIALEMTMENLPKNIQSVIAFLKERTGSDAAIILFGSRAGRSVHRNADFDIGIAVSPKLSWKQFASLKTDAEELAWPYRLDLVDLTRAPDEFLKVIEHEMVLLSGIWKGGNYVR